jgi:ketol-acid reductoisomerase
MSTYYDNDIDTKPLINKRIVIIGFGAQGRSHALNLQDSGCDVVVALRANSASVAPATSMGLKVQELDEAIQNADIVMMLSPDGTHPKLYRDHLEPNLKPQAMIMFAHGYNIHYETLQPRADLDITMVAPLGIGDQVRIMFTKGAGVPALLAVHNDVSGQAKEIALAYAAANGHGRAGIIETTFSEETETDLFAEQAILCGGITHLIEAGFETLVEAGYQPELAYFSCLHELKLIIDLIYSRGIAGMRQSISQTAEFGDYTRGPRVINGQSRSEMRAMLKEVQSGKFAQELATELSTGTPVINSGRANSLAHPITAIGERLRAMMPWMKD